MAAGLDYGNLHSELRCPRCDFRFIAQSREARRVQCGCTNSFLATFDPNLNEWSYTVGFREFGPNTMFVNRESDEFVKIPDNFYKHFTMSIGNIAKRILDPDTRKLMKAGFLDANLSLTIEGDSQLRAIVFAAHKSELLKAADEAIAEAKEE